MGPATKRFALHARCSHSDTALVSNDMLHSKSTRVVEVLACCLCVCEVSRREEGQDRCQAAYWQASQRAL